MSARGRQNHSKPTIKFNEKIGKHIATQRALRGFKQVGIAKEMGVSTCQMAKYEQGKNTISLEKLVLFASILKMSLLDLIKIFNISRSSSIEDKSLAYTAGLIVKVENPKRRKLINQLIKELRDD